MLKSLLREIIGTGYDGTKRGETLLPFRGKCRVLVLFEGAADERPEVQENYLANQQSVLTTNDIALLRVAGGGVFSSLDSPLDISADDLRGDLDGPSPEEFEAVLVDRDGAIVFRSAAPVQLNDVLTAIENVSSQRS